MDLTSYKEFSIPQTPPPIPEIVEKKKIKPKPIPKKKIIKEKIIISKPKVEEQEIEKKEITPTVQPKKKNSNQRRSYKQTSNPTYNIQ